MFLLATAALAAAPVLIDQGTVLPTPTDGTWPWGFGAPTVDWDGTQFVLYFESDAGGDAAAGCPNRYVIGRATSPDGVTWTVDAAPVLEGDPTDPRSARYCGVSQPGVAFDGGMWHLVFMENEYTEAPRTTSRADHLGYAQSLDGITFTVVDDDVAHDPAERRRVRSTWGGWPTGFPSVAVVEGEVTILFQTREGLGYVRTDAVGGLGQMYYALDYQYSDRLLRDVYSPSLACSDDPAVAFQVLMLGRDGRDNGALWTENEAPWIDSRELQWVDGSGIADFADVRHVEILRAGTTDLMAWYAALDADGHRVIGYAATTASPGAPVGRSCDVALGEGESLPADVYAPPDTGRPRDWPASGAAEDPRDADTGDDTAVVDTEAGDSGDSAGDTALDSGDTALDSGDTALDSGDTALDSGDTALDSRDSGDSATDTAAPPSTGCAGDTPGGGGCASSGRGPGAWALGIAGLVLARRRTR